MTPNAVTNVNKKKIYILKCHQVFLFRGDLVAWKSDLIYFQCLVNKGATSTRHRQPESWKSVLEVWLLFLEKHSSHASCLSIRVLGLRVLTWWCRCVRSWQRDAVGWCRWDQSSLRAWPPAELHTCYCSVAAGPPAGQTDDHTHTQKPITDRKTEKRDIKIIGQYQKKKKKDSVWLTPTRPNSQARSNGVFPALSTMQGFDWCCRSISDCGQVASC